MTRVNKNIIFTGLSILFSLVLIIDCFSPSTKKIMHVMEMKLNHPKSIKYGDTEKYGVITETENIPITEELYYILRYDDEIIVLKSKFFNINKKIIFNNKKYTIFSIYNVFCIGPILIFICSLIAFIYTLKTRAIPVIIFVFIAVTETMLIFGYLLNKII